MSEPDCGPGSGGGGEGLGANVCISTSRMAISAMAYFAICIAISK